MPIYVGRHDIHPYLLTPYGPQSICTSGTPGVIENRDIGYYSPINNDFVDLYRNMPFAGTGLVQFTSVVATDGTRSRFRAGSSGRVEQCTDRLSIVDPAHPLGQRGSHRQHRERGNPVLHRNRDGVGAHDLKDTRT